MAARVGLVLGGLCVGLLLVECGLRCFLPLSNRRGGRLPFIADPDTGFRLAPGSTGSYGHGAPITLSSLGHRNREFDVRKSAGVRRVLVVGDSVTHGSGVGDEEVYTRVLEDLLGGAQKIQVVNAAVAVWAPVQYRKFLEKRGLALEPDLVVIGLFLGNDITRNDEAWVRNTTAVSSRLVLDKRMFDGMPWWKRAWRRVEPRLYSNLHGWRLLCDYRLIRSIRPGEFSPMLLEMLQDRAFIYQQRSQAGSAAEAAWSHTFEELSRIAALCRRRRTRLLVAILPEETQVNPRLWAALGFPKERYSLREPQRRLLEFCRARGISCLDTLPALLGAGEASAFLPDDTHPNALGHKLIAGAIAAWIEKRSGHLWLEPGPPARAARSGLD